MFRPRKGVSRDPLHQPVDVQATKRSSSSSSTSICRCSGNSTEFIEPSTLTCICSGHGIKFLQLLYINPQMFRPRNEVPRVPLHQPADVQAIVLSSASSSASTCICSGHGIKFLQLLYINPQMFRPRNEVPRVPLHQAADVQVTELSSYRSSTSTRRCSGHETKFLEFLYINLQMFRSRN